MIQSHATPEATKSFSSRFPGLLYKKLGLTGLTVSACGFGSYRADYRVREHTEALSFAVLSGINLIDTSSNYSDGGSEILAGRVLDSLIASGSIKREEVVIVTKGGYIQGKNFLSAKKKKEEGNPYPDVVEYTETLWHCISPEFLKDQINSSLERMQLETIDVYLLHNPEYFLDSKVSAELNREEIRHEYYNRIKKAFSYLETEIEKGRIGCYGISSNTFVHNADSPVFTSLETCLKVARQLGSIGNNHHFHVIQFPLNLFEKGAVLNLNHNSGNKTLLEFAKENSMGVLINRPLNAIIDSSLTRLADFEITEKTENLSESRINTEINILEKMENEFLNDDLNKIISDEKIHKAVNNFLKAGSMLSEKWKNFNSIENLNDFQKQFLIPRVNYAFSVVLAIPNITQEIKDKLDKIAKQINKVLKIISSLYGIKANLRSQKIHDKLNSLTSNEDFKKLTLSQKAVSLINSLDGVSCTLVGARQPKYVSDITRSMRFGRIENAEKILKDLQIDL